MNWRPTSKDILPERLSFLSWPVGALRDRGLLPPGLYSAVTKLLVSGVVAYCAFGIQRRKLGFYRLRPIGGLDLGAMFLIWAMVFWITFGLRSAQGLLISTGSGAPGDDAANELPWAVAYTNAVVVGLCEEFLYRGYFIEELGALIRHRKLAGSLSIVAFTLAHVSHVGWSLNLAITGIAGCAITILYFWRDNLWVCVLLHTGIDSLHVWASSP